MWLHILEIVNLGKSDRSILLQIVLEYVDHSFLKQFSHDINMCFSIKMS